jgi:hypothetical protein
MKYKVKNKTASSGIAFPPGLATNTSLTTDADEIVGITSKDSDAADQLLIRCFVLVRY